MTLFAALRRWRARRRAAAREATRIVDICEVCNKDLHRGEVWEIRSDATDDTEICDVPTMGGGTYMSATYCAEHAPPEAVHVVP